MNKSLLSIPVILISFVVTNSLVFASGKESSGGGTAGGGTGAGASRGVAPSRGAVGGTPHFSSAPRYYSPSNWSNRQYHPSQYHPSGAGLGTTGSRPFSYPAVRNATVHHGVPGKTENNQTRLTQKSREDRTGNYSSSAGTGKWSHSNFMGKSKLDPQTSARLRNWTGKRDTFKDARAKDAEHRRHHHGHDWWRHHCVVIIFFDWGFWGWDDGWWYPAWGYDPDYSYYEYNEPIYGYDGLPPDQVVANVQGALQQLGYYQNAVDGLIGPATRAAIANYQRDHRLPMTSAIDEPLLISLGFMSE